MFSSSPCAAPPASLPGASSGSCAPDIPAVGQLYSASGTGSPQIGPSPQRTCAMLARLQSLQASPEQSSLQTSRHASFRVERVAKLESVRMAIPVRRSRNDVQRDLRSRDRRKHQRGERRHGETAAHSCAVHGRGELCAEISRRASASFRKSSTLYNNNRPNKCRILIKVSWQTTAVGLGPRPGSWRRSISAGNSAGTYLPRDPAAACEDRRRRGGRAARRVPAAS